MDPWASAQTCVPSYGWVTRRLGQGSVTTSLGPVFSHRLALGMLAGRCFSGWPWESYRISYKAGMFDSLEPCLKPGEPRTLSSLVPSS